MKIKCKICKRTLTNPKNFECQMGDICRKRANLLRKENQGKIETSTTPISNETEVERLLLDIIKDSPFKGKVFAVGGYVRDQFLGCECKDLDLIVEEFGGAKNFSSYLHSQFNKETSSPYHVGASYPIYKLSFKGNISLNGKVYQTEGAEIDIADTQKESFPDDNSRQRITSYGNIFEDIARRDFTVNMLVRDLSTGEMKDISGTSLFDLKSGILRGHPKVELDKMFSEDPLRMIRLIRFQSKYKWKVPLSVIKAVKKNKERIRIVSKERIRDELIKICTSGGLQKAIRMMKATEILDEILPEISKLKGTHQDKYHHSEGDVYSHTMLVLNKSEKGLVPQLAAVLHDVGKPDSSSQDGDKIHFYGHEDVGAKIAEKVMSRLKFDNETISRVKKIVSLHMRAHGAATWGDKAVRKFIRDCGDELPYVLQLTENDGKSSFDENGKSLVSPIPELRRRIEKTKEIPVSSNPILNGNEIMTLLSIKPGKMVGQAIEFLVNLEDDFACNNQRLTKEEAIKSLKNWAQSFYE